MGSNVYKPVMQPQKRGWLRTKVAVAYFRAKRRRLWKSGSIDFASIGETNFEHIHFSNPSPLLRHLVGIDPQLEQNKITNLHIALKKINGVVLQPGQTFSFWEMIGKPTRRKGYVDGVVLKDGVFSSGLGGGLCHLSGLIYWATLHTPLDVTERHRHGYDTTPQRFFGHDATCFYNYKDLMVKNNTSQPFQLQVEINSEELIAIWLSNTPPSHRYEIYEKQGYLHMEDWGRQTRHNHVYRKTFDLDDNLIADDFISENHAIVM